MENITKNSLIETDIVDISNLGYGIGHASDGRVVFINGAVTGDRVKAKIIKVNTNYLVGHLEQIVNHSSHRSECRFCEAPISCGGCVYRDISYEYEKQLKEDYVRSVFRKAGLPHVIIDPLRSTNVINGYRNKGQFPVGQGKNGIEAGFYAVKSHHIIPANECQLHPSVFADIVHTICDFANKYHLSAYHEETGSGLLRHIFLRIGQVTKQIMVCLVINGTSLPYSEQLCKSLVAKYPTIASIQLNHNTEQTNIVLGNHYTLLYGQSYIEDELCGLKLHISPASFYQVNHDAAELLYTIGAQKVDFNGNETLLDLYCGIGSIGLSMAHQVRELYGIEIVPEAIQCADNNAELNKINNAHFACGDASDTAKLLEHAETLYGPIVPDIVILDPPRKGTTPELIQLISSKNIHKVLYISCNCETLARDCQLFETNGYTIGHVTPVDLFPRTGHVESVVLMSRA